MELNWVFLKKMGQPRPLVCLFSVLKKCHVYPVYGAEIRTHDLSNMSRLP